MISARMDEQLARPTEEDQAAPPPAPQRRSRGWLWLLLLLIAGGAAWLIWTRIVHPSTTTRGAGGAGANRPVPIVVATARLGDMNIYLTGLGTVTAFNTVSIKSRVDGQITKVYFTEGQIVKAGDPLVEIDPRPFQVQLEQAEGQLLKDQAALANAQLDLQRYESIKESVTPQQISTQQATVVQEQGIVKSDQSLVDNAKLQLTYCHITAPIAGRIGLRMVDEGNLIHANDPSGLAVITQLQPIAVIFTIAEDLISQVITRPDHGIGLEVDAYDHEQKAKLASGSVLAIDNQADPSTGTVRIKAQFPNEDNALFPNQFVNASLLVQTLHGVVIVPSAAVQLGPTPQDKFVYVVGSGDKVALRHVVIGAEEGDETVIQQGVSAGEVLVTEGVDKLQDGYKVVPRRAPAHPAATTAPASRPARSQPASHPASRGSE